MWAQAYLEQARSDWATKEIVGQNSCEACHELHYLQMATEKLGKAVLLRSGSSLDEVNSTHNTFIGFLRLAARNPGLRQAVGQNARQLQCHMRGLLPIAEQIARLAPALAQGGPNAEYPWQIPSGKIMVPASHEFTIARDLRGPNGRKLLTLVKIVLDQFDGLF